MELKNTDFKDIERPSDDINPDVKRNDKDWFVSYGKYIMDYGEKNADTPYAMRDIFAIQRAYGDGMQDSDQYKPHFDVNINNETTTQSTQYDSGFTKEEKRQGLMNIDWSIVPIMPKYVRILLGVFSTMEHVIGATALDKISSMEKEDAKWELYKENYTQAFKQRAYERRGMAYDKQSYVPEDTQELNLFESMGGFKLNQELAMEFMIQHNFDISDWDKEIKDLIYGDLIKINYAAVRDELDTQINKTRIKYVDPASVIIQRDSSPLYKNAEFWGYIENYSIAELRQKGFEEDDLYAMATENGYTGSKNYTTSVNRLSSDNPTPYDNHKIKVLVFETISTDTFYDTLVKSSYGQERVYAQKGKEWGKEKDSEKRKTRKTQINNVYYGHLIIGTEHCFEYGIKSGQPRENGEVRLSLKMVKMPGQSMVQSCIPILNEIQLDMLKLQNAKANAAPPGLAINIDSISNLKIGGNKLSPMTILEIRRTKGDLLFKVTPMGLSGFGNNLGKPMEELRGGLGELGVELLNDIKFRIEMLRDITGINQVADASTPDPNASVRGSELALHATNNAIRPLYKAYMNLKELIALSGCIRSQILLKNFPEAYEAYYPVLGKHTLKTLQISEKIVRTNYAIKVEAAPTEKQKAELDNYITVAMQSGKNGVPLIRASHGLLLKEMTASNVPLKSVRVMISFLENKERQLNHQMEIERVQAQGEEKRKSDIQAFEISKQIKQNEAMLAIEIDNNKSKNKIQEIRAEKMFEATITMPAESEFEKRIATVESLLLRAEQGERIALESRLQRETSNVN